MIRFNKPFIIDNEIDYIKDAILNKGMLCGDGAYTHKCNELLQNKLGANKVLLTHSCTAALEMAAILLDIKAGDEIIMPSYTFVSTANAFVLRGGVPVFVDIRQDTLNIDETLIEQAITSKTKAICVVHYAGVACEMDTIIVIANKYNLAVIEDAAQALGSSYKERQLGTIGDMGCFSFHETKNIIAGEGGALAVNNDKYSHRAEIIREKGTNRSQFFRGVVDKYTWVDIGSSYLPSDMIAAFLYSQLENMDQINAKRMSIWNIYNNFFSSYTNRVKLPYIPKYCAHNAHMFYLILNNLEDRTNFIEFMKQKGVNPVFHYIPLHSSPAGKLFSKIYGSMITTDNISDTLVRLPMYYDLSDKELKIIMCYAGEFLNK